ncbi:MAG: Regulatory protein RecX [Candidatus Levybacteria bacterium GW2011_GWA2_36_13]|nr:MAG: Regulatory protein RecX [Candidatus Levybacteria bacterium GW2011_GWA2_36_13]
MKKKKLSREDLFEIYLNNILKFIGYRSRSEKEIIDRLRKKKIDEKMISEIMAKLQEWKFIDDIAFAKQWIESRVVNRHKSIRLVRLELLKKGIKKEIIDSLFENLSKESDVISIEAIIRKKIKRLNIQDRNDLQKLSRYLLGKGFDWETVKEAINKFRKDSIIDQ